MLRLKNTGKVRKAIQEAYPIVKDISFQKVSANTVSASLSFNSVDLLFTNEAVTIGYGNKRLFTVHQGDTIASGALTIRLPDYFSGDKIQAYTTGYVLLASPEKLKGDYHLIADALPIDDIFFVAGSQKSIISSANKSIVFDHKRSIAAQLEYLKTVARTLSGDVVYEIDLATYPTVIIRKN